MFHYHRQPKKPDPYLKRRLDDRAAFASSNNAPVLWVCFMTMVSMTKTQLIKMKLPSLERNITTFCLHITLYYSNLVKCFFLRTEFIRLQKTWTGKPSSCVSKWHLIIAIYIKAYKYLFYFSNINFFYYQFNHNWWNMSRIISIFLYYKTQNTTPSSVHQQS